MKRSFFKFSFIILVIFSFILLASCDGKNNQNNNNNKKDSVELKGDMSIIASSTNYDLVVGDELNPINEEYRSNYTYKSTDDKILSVDSSGKVKALAKGEAKLVVYIRDDIYGRINFNIKDKDSVNYNYNEATFNDLKNLLSQFENKDSATIILEMNMNGTRTEMKSKMIKSPFYMELENGTGEGRSHYIVEEINNKYVVSEVDHVFKEITRKVVSKDKFNSSEYSLDVDALTEFDSFDKNKIELNKLGSNKFEIKFALKDSLSFSSMLIDQETLSYIGSLDNIIIDTIIEVKNNEVKIDMEFNLHFITMNMVFDLPMIVQFTYQFNNVEKFDTTNYLIKKPQSFDEVFEETDTTKPLSLEQFEDYYGYGYFEEGYYAIESDNSNYFRFDLYDTNQNKLNINKKNFSSSDLSFEVLESGYYYFVLDNQISADTNVSFVKLDYKPQNKELKTCSGFLVGKYDFVKFNYSSTDENEYIKITNNSNKEINLYTSGYDTINYINLSSGSTEYYNPTEDFNIYLYSFDDTLDYNITVESVINANGADYENLDLITSEYGKTYIMGGHYSDRKVKLVVEEKGFYKFKYKDIDGQERNLTVYIAEGSFGSNYEYVIDKGTYTLTLPNGWSIKLVQIKYEYYDLNDKDINIELPVATDSSSGETIKNEALTEEQVVRYHFTLEEDEIVEVGSLVQIYDSNDKLLTFEKSIYSRFDRNWEYYKLKAGSYYAINPDTGRFVLRIIKYQLYKSPFDYDTIEEVKLNDTIQLEKSCGIYTFTPTANMTIKFTLNNLVVDVFDENKKLISRVDAVSGFNLDANKTYYIVLVKKEINQSAHAKIE